MPTVSGPGKRIVTASFDKTARVWNADGTGQPLVLRGHQDRVYSAGFSPDGKRIVTASFDKTARVWNADGTPGEVPGTSEGRSSGTLPLKRQGRGEESRWQPLCFFCAFQLPIYATKGHRLRRDSFMIPINPAGYPPASNYFGGFHHQLAGSCVTPRSLGLTQLPRRALLSTSWTAKDPLQDLGVATLAASRLGYGPAHSSPERCRRFVRRGAPPASSPTPAPTRDRWSPKCSAALADHWRARTHQRGSLRFLPLGSLAEV